MLCGIKELMKRQYVYVQTMHRPRTFCRFSLTAELDPIQHSLSVLHITTRC